MKRTAVVCAIVLAALLLTDRPSATGEALRFGDVERLVQMNALASVEALINALPQAAFDDYVLMHDTRSNQKAGKRTPRVILFDGGGDLVLAYGGEGHTVEAIEFDRTQRKWNFHLVDFDQQPPVVAAPTGCQKCHQDPLRPNWEPYAKWPGAYDAFEGGSREVEKQEKQDYAAFLKNTQGPDDRHPRYQRLPFLAQHYEQVDGLPRPNTRLTITLAFRNFQRIAAQLSERPDFPRIKFAIAAANVPKCVKVSDTLAVEMPFLPAGSALRRQAEESLSRRLKLQKEKFGQTRAIELQATLAILEATGQPKDLDTKKLLENWTMAFDVDRNDILRGGAPTLDPLAHGLGGAAELLPWGLAQVDPQIQNVVSPFLKPYLDPIPVPDNETPAQRHTRLVSVAVLKNSVLPDGRRQDACNALTERALRALR